MLDVVTLGEAMLRLSAAPGESLEAAPALAVRAAGAEANVAVTLARLGFRTGWISRLPDDALGRRVAGEIRRHGVDVSAVVWAERGRTGLYFLERGVTPRGTAVHYDRAGSAFSEIDAEAIDWDYARAARWVHVTGITPALGPGCAAAAARLIREARASGGRVSFDVNYRHKLWSLEAARATLDPMLRELDLLVMTRDDAQALFGLEGPPAAQAETARARWRCGAVAVTAGTDGACLAAADGLAAVRAVPGVELDRIGRGDAFAAGLLWGALDGDLRAGLRYGAALAALCQTYEGDVAWVTRDDVLALLAGAASRTAR
ncbi:MAG: sugar kinase [Armatimonadota bacterium]|nr:sugar kinase [Armatimonadota bacterium]